MSLHFTEHGLPFSARYSVQVGLKTRTKEVALFEIGKRDPQKFPFWKIQTHFSLFDEKVGLKPIEPWCRTSKTRTKEFALFQKWALFGGVFSGKSGPQRKKTGTTNFSFLKFFIFWGSFRVNFAKNRATAQKNGHRRFSIFKIWIFRGVFPGKFLQKFEIFGGAFRTKTVPRLKKTATRIFWSKNDVIFFVQNLQIFWWNFG